MNTFPFGISGSYRKVSEPMSGTQLKKPAGSGSTRLDCLFLPAVHVRLELERLRSLRSHGGAGE
jgi:hypothetical protein